MMSDSWPRVPLSEVTVPVERPERPVPGTVYRQVGVKLWGQGAYEREPMDGSQTKYKTLSRVETDDIIVNKIWARNGSVAVVPPGLAGCYASSEFPTFVPVRDRLNPRWFHWFTKTRDLWEQCDAKSRGTSGKNRIRPERFLEIEIPLPPLPEQRRIVARIEELAALIEEARSLRERAREESQALLSAALHEVFSSETEAWELRPVEELCDKPQYGYTESAQRERVGPKFLRITDIQNGTVNWDTVPYCACEDVDKYRLQPGDILFARTGATTGKSFLVKECPTAVFASYLIRLRLKPGLEPAYLHWFFQSPQYWAQVYEEKKGSAQANMNGQKLSGVVVPVALGEDRRRRIVAHLDRLQAQVAGLTALQQSTQAELDALLPAVLERAFRGEL